MQLSQTIKPIYYTIILLFPLLVINHIVNGASLKPDSISWSYNEIKEIGVTSDLSFVRKLLNFNGKHNLSITGEGEYSRIVILIVDYTGSGKYKLDSVNKSYGTINKMTNVDSRETSSLDGFEGHRSFWGFIKIEEVTKKERLASFMFRISTSYSRSNIVKEPENYITVSGEINFYENLSNAEEMKRQIANSPDAAFVFDSIGQEFDELESASIRKYLKADIVKGVTFEDIRDSIERDIMEDAQAEKGTGEVYLRYIGLYDQFKKREDIRTINVNEKEFSNAELLKSMYRSVPYDPYIVLNMGVMTLINNLESWPDKFLNAKDKNQIANFAIDTFYKKPDEAEVKAISKAIKEGIAKGITLEGMMKSIESDIVVTIGKKKERNEHLILRYIEAFKMLKEQEVANAKKIEVTYGDIFKTMKKFMPNAPGLGIIQLLAELESRSDKSITEKDRVLITEYANTIYKDMVKQGGIEAVKEVQEVILKALVGN